MSDNAKATATSSSSLWMRLAAIGLALVSLGLPVNDLLSYTLLALAALAAFTGEIVDDRRRWLAAAGIAVGVIALKLVASPAPIQEGHNVFLPEEKPGALTRGLPPPVYRFMQQQFDLAYPPERRCARAPGCWRGDHAGEVFAFSADGILARPDHSRAVTAIDFDNPVWLRLGFANDGRYNWYSGIDALERVKRDRRAWKGYDRWQFAMPWFVMYRFPSAYAGSTLCWRGDVLWETSDGSFAAFRHAETACRTLDANDTNKSIFGVAISPGSLAMKLYASPVIETRHVLVRVASVIAALGIVLLLVRLDGRRAARSAILVALSLAVIAVDDLSFVGGFRPFDGGDDGLFYMSVAQRIVQDALGGDIAAALRGGESVYYYGGPGLRYLRAAEMVVFGNTSLGYLSLLLLLPLIVYGLVRLFFPDSIAWPWALIFTAVPLGEIFGTSFFHYAKWAARGFADPASQAFLVAGMAVIVATGMRDALLRAPPLAWGSFLLAISVFVKPIIAPMVAVFLTGVGLRILWQRHWASFAALCAGFTPVLLMPLHNLYFGRQFVLFSSNANLPETYPMPPSAYCAALLELFKLDWAGEHVRRAVAHLGMWLSGPGQLSFTIPLHAAAVGLLIYVAALGARFGFWLRLLAAAALAEHAVALFYLPTPRYFYAMWLVTAVVVTAFLVQVLPPRWPRFAAFLGKANAARAS